MLIKYSGKYIEIYLNLKITFFNVLHSFTLRRILLPLHYRYLRKLLILLYMVLSYFKVVNLNTIHCYFKKNVKF